MISWVNNKQINTENITKKINECIVSRHFTNNGKNVIELQEKIKFMFNLDENKEVLMVCNGAMGINALVGGMNIYHEKKLKFAVQSFTFPCSVQGLLMDSIVIDLDENMGPNIKILDEKKDDYDGILITNCFGCSTNIQLYEEFCKINNKILLFDNAASSYTMYNGKNHLNYGNGCMVSLHHTKPIGFGEGGFIVFDNKYLESMKKAICFGFTNTNRNNFNINASNYKMSEINAIYLSDYLNNLTIIYEHSKNMMKYFIKKLDENKLNEHIKIYKNFANYDESLMSTIPLLFKHDILVDFFIASKIEAKKYYFPLDGTHNISVSIFNKIICLPLNLAVTESVIDMYINLILLII